MFLIRGILYSLPLWILLAGGSLFRTVAGFRLVAESDALIHVISKRIDRLSPLESKDGVEGEICGLLFEPLLRRDASGTLQPNLITGWSFRSVVTIRCNSEEAAGEAEARIRAGEAPAKEPRPIALERFGTVLTLVFDRVEPGLETPLLEALPQRLLGDFLALKVASDHSIRALISSWIESSGKKEQVSTVDFFGDREASLFISGAADPVVEELRTYLAANPEPKSHLEIVGRRCYSVDRETLIDLRPKVFWHDGVPFSAEDVRFSYDTLAGNSSESPLAQDFDFVHSLEIVSPLRLRFSSTGMPDTMEESWEKLPILPAHLLVGKKGEVVPEAISQYLLSPIGMGPYRLLRRRPDGGIDLAANPAYHRGVPRERLVRYVRVSSLEPILLSLQDGTLDQIEVDSRFAGWIQRNPGIVETLKDIPRFQELVVWNLKRPPFDRAPVRRALAQAINLKSIRLNDPNRYLTASSGVFARDAPFSPVPMTLPDFDPAGAKKLLDEAGFTVNEKVGFRSNSEGAACSFTLAVDATNPGLVTLARSLSRQWAEMSLRVEVEALAPELLYGERLPERKFDAVLLPRELPYGQDQRDIWHSEGSGNLSGLADKEVDTLTQSLCVGRDVEKLRETVERLQNRIAELQPVFFLGDSGRIITLRKGAIDIFPPDAEHPLPLAETTHRVEINRPWWVRHSPQQSPTP